MPDPSTTTPAPDGDAVERCVPIYDPADGEDDQNGCTTHAGPWPCAAREPVTPCPECGGLNGAHGMVHTRHGNGGGANRPCSRREPVTQDDREVCEHCPDGHSDPTTRPWAAFVASERDGDGQPTHLHVAPTAGQHVAESDAQWVRGLLNAARPSAPTVTAEQVRQAARAADGAEWGSLPWVHTFLAALGIEVQP